MKWGPAEWKRLPSWAVELERARQIDSRRVTRAVNEPPVMWWAISPWREVERLTDEPAEGAKP